jgi:hypothetical protein
MNPGPIWILSLGWLLRVMFLRQLGNTNCTDGTSGLDSKVPCHEAGMSLLPHTVTQTLRNPGAYPRALYQQ